MLVSEWRGHNGGGLELEALGGGGRGVDVVEGGGEGRMELGDGAGSKQVGGRDHEGISGEKGATHANMW